MTSQNTLISQFLKHRFSVKLDLGTRNRTLGANFSATGQKLPYFAVEIVSGSFFAIFLYF